MQETHGSDNTTLQSGVANPNNLIVGSYRQWVEITKQAIGDEPKKLGYNMRTLYK
jgi:hypothetical protein